METKTKLSRDLQESTDRISWYNHVKHTGRDAYDNNV